MINYSMKIAKTVNKERQHIGDVPIYLPEIEDVQSAICDLPSNAVTATDDGDYQFAPDVSQNARWVYKAIVAATVAQARNRLEPGTVDLRPGAKIATSLSELAEPPARSGEHLKNVHEAKASFGAYWEDQAAMGTISSGAAAALGRVFASPATFAALPAGSQDKVRERINTWMETLTDEELSRYERHIEKFTEDQTDALEGLEEL